MSPSQRNLLAAVAAMGVLLLLGGIIVQLFGQSQAPQTSKAGSESCQKFGINYATITPSDEKEFQRAQGYGMGYMLSIATGPGDVGSIVSSFNKAFDKGLTPILRICIGNTCAFSDPQTYVTFLNQVADQLAGKTFYAITGPNESLIEKWLTSPEASVAQIGAANAAYMNAIIAGVQRDNVRLLSPVFNVTDVANTEFISAMAANGANFAGLYGVAANSYNLNAQSTITSNLNTFRSNAQANGFGDKPIFVTEIGMYEAQSGTNYTDAKANLIREIGIMRGDPQIRAYLLFNSFGTNPDPTFTYNVFPSQDIIEMAGQDCVDTSLLAGLPAINSPYGGNDEPTDPTDPVEPSEPTEPNNPSEPGTTPPSSTGKRCGEFCLTDSDCVANSATGAKVVCNTDEAVCVNANCPNEIYDTDDANCDCRQKLNTCGQPCSAAIGLCATGSVCTYINGAECAPNADINRPNVTFCVPEGKAGYSRPKCVGNDQGNSYFLGPNNKTAFTQSELNALCGVTAPTTPTTRPTVTPTRPTTLPQTDLDAQTAFYLIAGGVSLAVGVVIYRKYNKAQGRVFVE